MLFSVITVTFNAARFLQETLQSVAQQKNVTFEHLIWDGGSQDLTLEIAQKFSHVKILQGKDSGIADAMNRATEHARGDFLIHLHADDLLAHPQALQMAARALKLHPGAEWLYGKAHVIDDQGSRIRTTPYEPFTPKRLRKYNFITHPATVISRSLFKKIGGFDPRLRYCMDYDFWQRLTRLSYPLVLATPLASFREHAHSLSTCEPLAVTDEAYLVRNRYTCTFYEHFRSYWTWKKRRNHLTKEK
jgi:glycosyltransferase involved in cell wall biosynthesis